MVLNMTMNDRIEILQNTLDMLDVIYKEYDIRKFMKMVHTVQYDTELIPGSFINTIDSTLKLNDIYFKQ